MTIDEAIETAQRELNAHPYHKDIDFCKAVRLGIEALKEKRQTRYASHRTEYDLLPGETEE